MLTKLIKEAQNQIIEMDFNNGWNVEDNKLQLKYYEDAAYPIDISQIVDKDDGESDENDDDDDYISEGDESSDNHSDDE